MKRILSIILLASACYSANAQETATSEKKVRFGIKAGVNSSSLNWNIQGPQISSIQSFYAGGIIVFSVSKHFNIQSELIYSGEGAKASGTKLELNYLRLPLLFQYQHSSGLHVEAGLQPGFMITSKATHVDSEEEEYTKDQLTKAGTHIAFGFGYRMKNGLGIDFRYAKGIDNPISAAGAKLIVVSGGLSFVF